MRRQAFADGKPDEYFKTKEAFATFVSLLPHNPNVHFWPQTEYCLLKDLGKELPFYRFVGVMNATYAEQVRMRHALPPSPRLTVGVSHPHAQTVVGFRRR